MTHDFVHWEEDRWQASALQWRKQWGGNDFSIGFDLISPQFTPGQFTQLAIEGERGKIIRPLSLVNLPQQPYEFYMSARANGIFSQALLHAPLGTPVWISHSCMGLFSLKTIKKCRHLYLISTGTGLSPYLSFLRQGKISQLADKIVLIHGLRHFEHLAYKEELHCFIQQYAPKLSIILSVTSAESMSKLALSAGEFLKPLTPLNAHRFTAFYAGRISTMLFSAEPFCSELDFSPEHDIVFICGNSDMVRDLKQWFVQKKLFQKYSPLTQSGLLLEGY